MRSVIPYSAVALVLVLAGGLFAGAIISEFRAEPGTNRVELKWIVAHESMTRGYRIYRGMDGASFDALDFIPCKEGANGEKTYTYIDETVFKSSGNIFYYKLAVVNSDDAELFYDRILTVAPQISSARHTWGSIKAMFR
ncbi:MAG TPA: hypothetical protein PKW76_13405 [bacterium]|nr:hypothetical protein [bacterium]HPG46667.1 hypothetical protein [bacterium]HPM98801.1 hypothetical protein [bacterium]